MSQSDSSLPTVVLVPPAEKKPRVRRKLPVLPENVPWMKIAIGGSVAWMAVLLMVAVYFATRPEVQPLNDEDLLAAPAFKPPVQRDPVVAKPVKPVKVAAEPKANEPLEELDPFPINKDEFVDCERVGVNVRFMKEPAEAFPRARAEKKMVFMVHLSGNLEDKEFT